MFIDHLYHCHLFVNMLVKLSAPVYVNVSVNLLVNLSIPVSVNVSVNLLVTCVRNCVDTVPRSASKYVRPQATSITSTKILYTVLTFSLLIFLTFYTSNIYNFNNTFFNSTFTNLFFNSGNSLLSFNLTLFGPDGGGFRHAGIFF